MAEHNNYNNINEDDDDKKDVCYRTFDRSKKSDVDGLVELIHQLQKHECTLFDRMLPPEKMNLREDYIAGLEESCLESNGHILLAVLRRRGSASSTASEQENEDGKIIGYAVVLTKVSSNPEEDYEREYTYGSIMDLAVHSDFQRKGIGRALLEQCQERVQAEGTRYLRVEVLAKNKAAMSAYHQFGFHNHLVTLEKELEDDNKKNVRKE